MDASNTMPMNGMIPQREDNVVNRKADQSLYQICVNLRRRLQEVPGFDVHMREMEEEDEEEEATDPVTSLWRCFRKGYPLMTIFNASSPEVPLDVDVAKVGEAKVGKAATFKFLHACMTEFEMLPQDCFLITDLYTDDTNGFVKVAKVVNRALDILEQRGIIRPRQGMALQQQQEAASARLENIPNSRRPIRELIVTEKDYISHLETLQLLKKQLEETGRLTGDSIYAIFLNLNNILDFGRRFLIRIEQHEQLPQSEQNWGQLFLHYQAAFAVYEPFIANNERCTATVEREWEKIQMIGSYSKDFQQMVASIATLSGFLLKPFQRMTKYPLLLKEIQQHGELDDAQKADISQAIDSIQEVLSRSNAAVDKEHRAAALTELHQRVDDWKGMKRDSFGELLLFGNFTVLKSDSGKDTEREVRELLDDFDPVCMNLLRSLLSDIPPLRIAGVRTRAFTARRSFGVRRRPVTPKPSPGVKGVFGKAARSMRDVGNRPSPPVTPENSPQSALDEGELVIAYPRSDPVGNHLKRRGIRGVRGRTLEAMRLRKRPTPMPPLSYFIHTFLFNGVFSQGNMFLQSSSVINSRSVPIEHWKQLDPFEEEVAKEMKLTNPYVIQYSIYLFERILLCCKDVNPTKQRPSVMGRKEKPLANVKGKPRLQLKGRIFMANVTEIVSICKAGSYTIQIFWKGDPGVENFIIRFQTEEAMRKWYKAIDSQRLIRGEERLRQQGTSNTQFNYLMNAQNLENPYSQEDDADYEEIQAAHQSEFAMSRNASSTSLRGRSGTNGSGGSGGTVRPSRFVQQENAIGGGPLYVNTQFSNPAPSPQERPGNSYFSPVDPTPLSTRSSTSQSGSYFPRQPTPVNNRDHENNRYTAPALSRVSSRESQQTYYANGRTSRPTLQSAATTMNTSQVVTAQNRARSASSPDIHNPNAGPRRYPTTIPVDNIPVPPIPAHVTGVRAPVNRSQNNSPTNSPHTLPLRGMPLPNHYHHHPHYGPYRHQNSSYTYDQPPRHDGRSPLSSTPHDNEPADRVLSPPIQDNFMPGQLKAKVSFEDNYVTLVIASNIHFQSLTDRVEAKLARFTNKPIGKNSVRLRYKDEDGDFVTIDSDEAVQEAFLEWREQHRDLLAAGQMSQVGEIQLFCQLIEAV